MNRCFAFLLAVLLASITISSACVAQPTEWTRFTLRSQSGSDQLKASFSRDRNGRGEHEWSTGLRPSELIGLSTGFARLPLMPSAGRRLVAAAARSAEPSVGWSNANSDDPQAG